MIYHIMLIQTTAQKNTPLFVFPLVLQKTAINIHRLLGMAVVSPHVIFQMITVVLQSCREIGRHEKTTPEAIHVLCASHHSEIGGLAIGIRILSATVIAVPVGIGSRSKNTETMFLIG